MKMRTLGVVTQIAAVLVFLTSLIYGMIGASYSFSNKILIAFIQGHLNNPAIMWMGIIGLFSSCIVIVFNMQVCRMGEDVEEKRIEFAQEHVRKALERAAHNMSELWQARSGEIKTILESYPDSEIN